MKYICVIEEISNFDFIYFLWNCPAGGGGIWHIATASKWNAIPASSNLTPFCLLPPPRFQTVSPRCYITSRRKGGGRGEMGRALIDNRFPSRENLFLRFWMKRKSSSSSFLALHFAIFTLEHSFTGEKNWIFGLLLVCSPILLSSSSLKTQMSRSYVQARV